jgi:nitrite reductase/ring-hydroxylating ferredoxin subunit
MGGGQPDAELRPGGPLSGPRPWVSGRLTVNHHGMSARDSRPRYPGRQDWSSWPRYEAAADGFRGYWYPVTWSTRVTGTPSAFTICGENITLIRDRGTAYALHDRCPHRGVPLSLGKAQFPGTVSCAYHGWTFRLTDGNLCAVITDGPDSPIRGKVSAGTYRVAERLGMAWVYIPVATEEPPAIDDQLPEELRAHPFVLGGRIDQRSGNWRFACENGFDEGHAKYLHRTSLWRLFKAMPTWNITRIVPAGRWIYRVQDEVHWEAEFPGVGHWTGKRWWRLRPPTGTFNIGNTGTPKKVDPVIAAQGFPGFASLAMPGVLRIAYPKFIHYEFYVPVDSERHQYVGVMVNFLTGWRTLRFYVKYLGAIRWLFHGQFSRQDAWMVDVTDAPPERLYRPDVSLTAWRALAEKDAGRTEAAATTASGSASGTGMDDEAEATAHPASRRAGLPGVLQRASNTQVHRIRP